MAKKLSEEYQVKREVTGYRRSKTKKTNSVQEKVTIIGWVLAALVIGLMLIAAHTQVTICSAKIIQIKTEITGLQNSNERLKLKIAELKSPDRVEKIAITKLGMIKPGESDVQYLAIEEKKVPQQISEAKKENNKDQTGKEKTHPVLQAINKLVYDYTFAVRDMETSEVSSEQ